MIITKIMGGLGNQMFQYAIARHLSITKNTKLILDISAFNTYKIRKYDLSKFHIRSNSEIKIDLYPYKKKNNLNRIKILIITLLGYTLYQEKNMVFDAKISKLGKNIYLNGYFQTEKYFRSIRDILLEDFTVKPAPEGKNIEYLNKIKHSESVALHIRRGDYIQSAETYQKHGTCDLSYYHNAVKFICSKGVHPVFYIFSDDIEWAQKNLQLNYQHYFIDFNNADKNHEDLRLMYSCKHNIIANSTFSWWGAWLNQNPNKIVVAPKAWFADIDKNTMAKDLVPENWIRIGSAPMNLN